MAEKNPENELWHRATVLIRADIYRLAQQQGIDIGEECNRAIAARVGIGYRDTVSRAAPQEPVIIAPNAAPMPERKARTGRQASAIINADDPLSARAVKARKGRPPEAAGKGPAPAPVPAAAPVPVAVPAPVTPAPPPPDSGRSVRTKPVKDRSPARKKKEDPVKKFCSTMILRTDEHGAGVPKDEMYEIFGRWCRDHRFFPVPEKRSFSVALKNQFALTEKVVAGTPSWTGIRLK
ncbi:MAG TPA: hypothetical protein VLY83_00340 [Methanoregula sp.]|nr:hypothetical protein [Methanoregula sp.]